MIALGGGLVYAAVVFAWLRANGVYWTTSDPLVTTAALGYAVGGLFVMSAVPLYLLGRLSLATPALVTLWLLGDTVYQWADGTHLHPLSSYLTVWPLLFGLALAAGVVEAFLRLATQRFADRGGLEPLV